MGYKSMSVDKENPAYGIFKNREWIFKNLNVASLGYVTYVGEGSTYYEVQLSPILPGKTKKDYYIRKVKVLEGLEITKGDLVIVLFLDNYGEKALTYEDQYSRMGTVPELTEKESDILHDYSCGVIIGKVKK